MSKGSNRKLKGCRMGKRGFETHKYNNGLGKPIKDGEIDGNR